MMDRRAFLRRASGAAAVAMVAPVAVAEQLAVAGPTAQAVALPANAWANAGAWAAYDFYADEISSVAVFDRALTDTEIRRWAEQM